MTKVKVAAKTTISMLAVGVSLYLIIFKLGIFSRKALYALDSVLQTKALLQHSHQTVLSISFWMLLISCMVESIYQSKYGWEILLVFMRLLIFLFVVAFSANMVITEDYGRQWFWLIYHASLFIAVHRSCKRLSGVRFPISFHIKRYMMENMDDYIPADRIALFVVKVLLLLTWLTLLTFLIYFVIDKKTNFCIFS